MCTTLNGATWTYSTASIAKYIYNSRFFINFSSRAIVLVEDILFTLFSQFISIYTTIILFRLLTCHSLENNKYIYIIYSIGVSFALSDDSRPSQSMRPIGCPKHLNFLRKLLVKYNYFPFSSSQRTQGGLENFCIISVIVDR